LLGVFALVIFVYKMSVCSHSQSIKSDDDPMDNEDDESLVGGPAEVHFPTFPFIIVMISLIFFMSSGSIGSVLPNRLGLTNTEVGPTFSATMDITKSVLKESPVFGIGPNKFGEAWAMYKSPSVNATNFWDVSFNSGSGLLPTFLATMGYAGILAWLTFFALFIWSGVRSIFSGIKNGINWETMAFFLLALYLFVCSFLYSVGPVIFLLSLAFTGVFVGLSASNSKEEITFSFLDDHRKSFFSMLFIILLVIISIATAFKYLERFTSVSYFRRALVADTVEKAETNINKALSLYVNDLYLRTYSEVYLLKLNALVSKGDSLTEEEKTLLQANLDQAINGANQAAIYNPKNYINFQELGTLYQNLASFGVKDAFSVSVEAYKQASILNPNNPGFKLSMAVASFADKKNTEAVDYAKAALNLKPDYVDAYLILAQVAKNSGDNALALDYANIALSIIPTNADLKKYVDSLKKSSSTVVAPPKVDLPEITTQAPDSPIKKKQ